MEVWIGYVVGIVTIASAFIGVFLQIGKDRGRLDDTATTVAAMKGQLTILESRHNEHRVEVAKTYATNIDVERAIDRLDATLRQYLDAVTRTAKSD